MAEKLVNDSVPEPQSRSTETTNCNIWHTVDTISQRPRASYQQQLQVLQKGVGVKTCTNYSAFVHHNDSMHHPGSDLDSALPDSGFSDSFDSSCCVTSDSEQEVRTSGGCRTGCREPVKFFVGLESESDSDSDEDDEFFTADECSDLSEENSEDDDVNVTFSNDLCCSFTPRPQICRSQSWTAPERTSCRSLHSRCLPQSFSASSVRHLAELNTNSESEVADLKTRKRVQFQDNPEVHCIVAWNYAYRAARKGPWEMIAITRDRFKKRVEESEQVFSHVFSVQHREKFFSKAGFIGQEASQCHSA